MMDDDFIDHDGNISISKVMTYPRYPADDPRHLSPEMRDRLCQQRLAQMEREAAARIAHLEAAGLKDAEF